MGKTVSPTIPPWSCTIDLTTPIAAPITACFDLSRQVDAHLSSAAQTGERAIAGKLSGYLELGDSVTWRAYHLGLWQTLTVEITAMEPPIYFVDEMVAGAFRYMRHEHYFEQTATGTLMRDHFVFAAPLGPLGWPVASIFLVPYMRHFLLQRNGWLKQNLEQ